MLNFNKVLTTVNEIESVFTGETLSQDVFNNMVELCDGIKCDVSFETKFNISRFNENYFIECVNFVNAMKDSSNDLMERASLAKIAGLLSVLA